ncbi:MAG: hypothetical protein RML84_04175 [Anaerolineae bacterium]|nr:hypothetical protein [Thermoflexales bacterium]MDW8292283.1 hypothetical protein [Anaerolineae bacterium]
MNTPFPQRLIGVVTFKAPIYREIAHDPEALLPSALIVFVGSLVAAVSVALLTPQLGFLEFTALFIAYIVLWPIESLVAALLATNLFNGKTDAVEMLRVLGYPSIFNVLTIIPCLGWIASFVLGVTGYVIAIRESAEITTVQAIVTAILVFIVGLVITLPLSLIFSAS